MIVTMMMVVSCSARVCVCLSPLHRAPLRAVRVAVVAAAAQGSNVAGGDNRNSHRTSKYSHVSACASDKALERRSHALDFLFVAAARSAAVCNWRKDERARIRVNVLEC